MSQTQSPQGPSNGPSSIPRKPVPPQTNQPSSRPSTPTTSITPPTLEKRPSLIHRATAAARKVLPGKPDQKEQDALKPGEKITRKISHALQHLTHQERTSTSTSKTRVRNSIDEEEEEEETPRTVLQSPRVLRSRALSRPQALNVTELNTLAAAEGVYIIPRRRQNGSGNGNGSVTNDTPYDRRHEEALLHGLVARLSKAKNTSENKSGNKSNKDGNADDENNADDDDDDDANASYIFLGADRALYRGRLDSGLDARRIDPNEENAPSSSSSVPSDYAEVRQLSRAYYQLCL